MPTASRILSHRRRDHERRRVPSRGRGAGAPHRVPHPAPQGTPRWWGPVSSHPRRARASQKKGRCGDAPPHHRSPVDRTRPARAPRPASQSPESKICGRWRGQLTRTSFGGSLCRARAWGSARARTTTPLHPRTPAERIGARAGASPRLADPTFTKGGKVGRAADAHPPRRPFFWCRARASEHSARARRRTTLPHPPPSTLSKVSPRSL